MHLNWKNVFSLATCLSAVGVDASKPSNGAALKVKTTSGQLTGFINSTAPAVRQFLGVPFAEPPVDALRFKAPKPKHSSKAIKATTYAPSCMQRLSSTPTVYTQHMQEFLINGGQSEDCLYLNVYAPLNPTEKKLPVFIYIPGGGFTGGGADSLYKIPDKWIQRTQSHIVVTMNYRVNVFGFPNAADASKNVGLLDQRLVVEWARDNIAAFGGNPKQMVLWGQSAGAASVGMYGYSYPNDLIVKGLILDSGSTSMLTAAAGNHSSFSSLAKLVGCGNLSAAKELACMQDVDATEIQDAYSGSSLGFSPVGDNVTAFSNTTDRLARGLVSKKEPWIMGVNANEGAGFGTYSESGMTPGQWQIGLAAIVCPVSKEIQNRVKFGYDTYRYHYAGNFSNISPLPWIGATHSAELPLLFGTHYEYRGNSTEFEWEVSYGMEALWLSFLSNPKKDPRDGHGITWPKYRPGRDTLAVFAEDDKWVQFVSESVDDGYCS
ncbi:Alpha/Beta hydrolase protein [Ilyonectria robusta]|uniref:Alpha/Beta hydrolase protein n=1 Tax=Ilyonectria robusta TaxID=1079257 RepID=UPI001E8E2A79|nr:Alpha/Beta hydrolase protein [Ilyonectria robusta]KAH8688339.1 Alpha/Beta hydrolase protein [Ilyonectria robusta]